MSRVEALSLPLLLVGSIAVFPDEGHGFVRLENRIRSAVAVVEWFSTHLQGGG